MQTGTAIYTGLVTEHYQLWLAGKEKWNERFQEHRLANVDLSGIQFLAGPGDEGCIDFRGFIFPAGRISFFDSTFEGNVRFDNCQISGDEVNFHCATFKGDVNFAATKFGPGNHSFIETKFERKANFEQSTFGEGNVDFSRAEFKKEANFKNSTFGNGDVKFNKAIFADGSVNFDDAILGKGNVDFRGAIFGRGAVRFANLAFAGTARFTDLRNLEKCSQFSFEGCAFEKLFTFSLAENDKGKAGRMGCPVDLRRTALKHDVVVQDINCDYAREAKRNRENGFPKAADKDDSQRFRKLKELAVANRNHGKALEFHAQEIATQRGHYGSKSENLAMAFWQFWYWSLSDYGRSVLRPLVGIVVILFGFATVFWTCATQKAGTFGDALIFSASNMFAFIPIGRTGRAQSTKALFCEDIPKEILLASGSQTLISVVLLFLLGLGLRNMFRI